MNKDENLINIIFPKNNLKENFIFHYDDVGLYSVSIKKDAKIITNFIKDCLNRKDINTKNTSIIDLNGGIGGNTISFCYLFKKVTSVEIDYERFKILNKNLSNYNFDNYNTIHGNCIDYLNLNYNVFFFDPPWGGPDYKNEKKLRLKLDDKKLIDLVKIIKKNNINSKICLKIPYNYDIDEFIEYEFEIKKIRNIIILFIY